MLISLNWLKEFVDIKLAPKELGKKLTMAGFEVEAILVIQNGGNDSLADSLLPPKPLGSPLAKPDGSPHVHDIIFEINVTPNRGDCLSVIGIAREIAAITGGKFKIPPPPPLKKGGVKPRWGHAPLRDEGGFKIKDHLSVEVKDKKKCIRYAARVVNGVKITPSPKWLAVRLEACGIRAINNVVDATNYVMLETGQPFHAFDIRHIRGKKIIIRTSGSDAEFVTLDGIKRKITKDDLLICDEGRAIALAGVMGGANSEVKPDTTGIILESACFDPSSVRKTSKRLGLSSESSHRFERGVDPSSTVLHLDRLARLIVEITAGTAITDCIDVYHRPVKAWKVKLNPNETARLLGIKIEHTLVKKYLTSIGIKIAGNTCTIPVWRPDLTRQADIIEEIARLHGYDRIHETLPSIRMSGLKIPDHYMAAKAAKNFLVDSGFCEAVNLGFGSPAEIKPFSVGFTPVEIANPLGVEGSVMRSSLIPGLLNNIKLNISYGQDAIKLFELRPVFLPDGGGFAEPKKLAGVMTGLRRPLGWTTKGEGIDFYDAKGICEALAQLLHMPALEFEKKECGFLRASAVIKSGGREVGMVGFLHPVVAAQWDIKNDVAVFELDFDEWAALSLEYRPIYKEMAKFPSMRRDVALLVLEAITSGEVISAVGAYKNQLIKDAFPFDVYKGKGIPEGKKSVAYAVMYADANRTLTDEEVNNAHTGLIGFLKEKLGAEVR